MYNQNSSQGQSQYGGMQRTFQPSGFVNSVYNQGQNSNFGGNQQQQQQQFSNPQSFHTAQYKGNQQGHDAYLRADSINPSQQGQYGSYQNQFGGQQGQMGSQQKQFSGQQGQMGSQQNQFGRSSYGTTTPSQGFNNSSFGSSSYSNNPSMNTQSLHTSNYRGNQQGHDANLRADSVNPSQLQNQFQSQNQNQIQNQNQMNTGFYGQGQ
jgi:hypothetical protein